MNDMTIEDALDYLDNICVCHGCECWQDHDWGGCYRTTTTGKMACDLRDEAVEVLRKVVFRAMGAKDINVPNKFATDNNVGDKTVKFKQDGEFLRCGKCNHIVDSGYKYCPKCGSRLEWNE